MNNKQLLVLLLCVIWIVCGVVDIKIGKVDALQGAVLITFLIGCGYVFIKS